MVPKLCVLRDLRFLLIPPIIQIFVHFTHAQDTYSFIPHFLSMCKMSLHVFSVFVLYTFIPGIRIHIVPTVNKNITNFAYSQYSVCHISFRHILNLF
jgi:hypothetical protein